MVQPLTGSVKASVGMAETERPTSGIEQPYPLQLISANLSKEEWVEADLVLGDARMGCRGTGICKIAERGPKGRSTCFEQVVPVWLFVINPRCLQLVVDKRLLSAEQRKRHYFSPYIELHHYFPLPMPLCYRLGLGFPVGIMPRKYPLYQNGHLYHHFLDCKHSGEQSSTPLWINS